MQPNFVIRNSADADLSLSNCQSTDPRLRVIVIHIAIFAGIIAGSGYHCVQDQTHRSCIADMFLKWDCAHWHRGNKKFKTKK